MCNGFLLYIRNMKWIFSALLLLSLKAFSQKNDLIHSVVATLAHDTMMGRAAGSKYEKKTIEYLKKIANDSCGLKLKESKFEMSLHSSDFLPCSNLYGFVNNRKKQTILISAHYDHLGFGGKLSRALVDNKVHNGADDNASGVALVLAFAKYIIQSKIKDYNYLFVFYTSHENGLDGSKMFASNKILQKNKPLLHINFDMVGRMRDGVLNYVTNKSSLQELTCANTNIQLKKGKQELIEKSDLKWSAEKNISCLHFTTGLHPDYHKPTDDVEYINFQGIRFILNFITKEHLNWAKGAS